ncbi:hypothetical protein UFOVP14_43 [uncultured Caudovirales phage]|uniref:Uncharacterized protein n=1 Tax=uncultured Caudovirales phage TaxID=2100421 RepID=A0A6J5KKD5_9CAUD|nr:hypothetical protein UFOVP14_43 [uncultured Caudovirales phage]
MQISENIIKLKAIVKRLESLSASANPIDYAPIFDAWIEAHIVVGSGMIEADRLGNL